MSLKKQLFVSLLRAQNYTNLRLIEIRCQRNVIIIRKLHRTLILMKLLRFHNYIRPYYQSERFLDYFLMYRNTLQKSVLNQPPHRICDGNELCSMVGYSNSFLNTYHTINKVNCLMPSSEYKNNKVNRFSLRSSVKTWQIFAKKIYTFSSLPDRRLLCIKLELYTATMSGCQLLYRNICYTTALCYCMVDIPDIITFNLFDI
ncbi:uncharacterized protein EV154DRAFT_487571 [Mucor mucedo]|uniref:uncharacterized protein n=1 Tax=Mucor mucedo TaxID=29922 RepID=UPI002220C818|nr:uncharacterized protein EV154DRAFT_487571 [Mucor mucedo]KAI7872226.1 hypothetical protein EV154DRAFT_487571 [Mucor mucedo]